MRPVLRKCLTAAAIAATVTIPTATVAEAGPWRLWPDAKTTPAVSLVRPLYCEQIRAHTINHPPFGQCVGAMWVYPSWMRPSWMSR